MVDSTQRGKLYPIRFKENLRPYGFGNRWIVEEYEKEDLPKDHPISETWEVVDRPGESSLILNGWMKGKTLHDAIEAGASGLLGRSIVARFGTTFPLIIKFLDASNTLAEHMHPSDELVMERGLRDNSGKTEAWYMLHAKPDATIHAGHLPGVTPTEFRQALIEDRSKDYMQEYSVQAGDSFLLPAGTMHYSAGGLIFYEIMQNSDLNVALRQYSSLDDVEAWANDAVGAVHFEDEFDCRTHPVSVKVGANTRTWLIACSYFTVERIDLIEPYELMMDGERFRFVTAIEGHVNVSCEGGTELLKSGWSCMLPADAGLMTIEPEESASILVSYVPDLVEDVVKPLREQSVPDEEIRYLGGRSELNPLNELTSV